MDPNFGIEVAYFSNEAIFEQRIRLKKPAATVKGVLEFMVCDDQRCLPPTEVQSSIKAENSDFGAAPLPKISDSGEKATRSEEHMSELIALLSISYSDPCSQTKHI